MGGQILVAYASNAGSTADVAKAVAEELRTAGLEVDARPIAELDSADLSSYSAVVVGAPMILGWHRRAEKFMKAHRAELANARVALFATAMTMTATGEPVSDQPPIFIDPKLLKPPSNPLRLGFKERFTTLAHYLGPILRSAGDVQPVSVGFFRGKLDFGRLKFLQMLFVMLIVGAQPGDYRNWDAIREWARGLPEKFALQ
jgi:menaquinone-dependent protoporphyrinogen oxidase